MISTNEKLYAAFAAGLHLDLSQIHDGLTYNAIPEWDSVGHMALIVEIETAFDVMLDTDDIVGLSSVGKSKEILGRYNITF